MTILQLIINTILYVLAGAFAGLMSGLLGIGGGIVMVPALIFIFSHDPHIPPQLIMHIAAATSLAVIIFTSRSAVVAHGKRNNLRWDVYRSLWPGIVIGVVFGVVLANYIPTEGLKVLLGVFLVFVAISMLRKKTPSVQHNPPRLWIHNLFSYLIGLNSGLLGIGGGVLIVPYLRYCGLDLRQVTAVSVLCTLTVAVIGAFTFILMGWSHLGFNLYFAGYIYLPAVLFLAIPSMLCAPLGVELTYRLPVKQVTYGFIVILLLTAAHLLFF